MKLKKQAPFWYKVPKQVPMASSSPASSLPNQMGSHSPCISSAQWFCPDMFCFSGFPSSWLPCCHTISIPLVMASQREPGSLGENLPIPLFLLLLAGWHLLSTSECVLSGRAGEGSPWRQYILSRDRWSGPWQEDQPRPLLMLQALVSNSSNQSLFPLSPCGAGCWRDSGSKKRHLRAPSLHTSPVILSQGGRKFVRLVRLQVTDWPEFAGRCGYCS